MNKETPATVAVGRRLVRIQHSACGLGSKAPAGAQGFPPSCPAPSGPGLGEVCWTVLLSPLRHRGPGAGLALPWPIPHP